MTIDDQTTELSQSDPTPASPTPTNSETALATALTDAVGGRWSATREELRRLGDSAPATPRRQMSMADHRTWVDEGISWIASTGMPADGFPVRLGGQGDIGASVTGFEMLGHGDLSLMVKAGVHWGLFGGAVANLGLERHAPLVASIIDASLPGCFAMTETGHGSDVQSLETTATYDRDSGELVIHSPTESSRKDYIGGAADSARMAAVFAQLVVPGRDGADDGHHGVHCILVPLRDEQGQVLPGVTIGDCGSKGGLLGVDNGRIMFDSVRVPRENLLGRYGDLDADGTYHSPIESSTRRFFTMLGTLVRGRISVAAGAGAATRSALEIATKYASVRTQFDAPGTDTEVTLLDYRTHQRKLMPAIATAYALMFAQNDLVSDMHDVQTRQSEVDDPASMPREGDAAAADEDAQRQLETLAAGLKAYTTRFATDTIQMCREACGGAGYLSANRLTALKADTDVFTTFEGDNTVLLQLVAKSLLTNFQRAFGSMDTIDLVRFGSRTVAESVVERTSARGLVQRLRDTWTSEHALTERAEQVRLITERETHLLETLARRLRRAGDKKADAFAVFNNAQDHLVDTATAHVERTVLEAFVAGIERCEDPYACRLLERVCDLYALTTIERNRAWYMEHDRLSPDRSKSLITLVNTLCAELRPHALDLVEGFGIPDGWLSTEMPQT